MGEVSDEKKMRIFTAVVRMVGQYLDGNTPAHVCREVRLGVVRLIWQFLLERDFVRFPLAPQKRVQYVDFTKTLKNEEQHYVEF